jgi:hypothetical protein
MVTMALKAAIQEWSRPPEPYPPYAGSWCGCRERRPNVRLSWFGTARTETGSNLDAVRALTLEIHQ